jgi:hypothetical protein
MKKLLSIGLLSACVCASIGVASAGAPVLIDSCAEGAAIGQPPTDPQGAPGFSGDGDDLRSYDDFPAVPGPITGIVWWGGGVAGDECVHEPNNFEIAFYESNGGQPGALITSQDVTPTVTSTGFAGPQGTLYRHEAIFASPVNVASGWVSVFAVDFDGCFFYWATGAEGNGNAYSSGLGNLATDYAFCLTTSGAFAATDCAPGASVGQPLSDTLTAVGFSDAGDGLRAYDNFSGLTDPIVHLVWWGGGTAGGNDCTRNADFEIAFFADNGGQPGALITSENVSASFAATGGSTMLGSLYRYEATLATPVDLASGWVSVFGVNFVDCYFYWANGEGGNGGAHTTNGSVLADFAFCLITDDGIHTADQDGNNAVSLSELLRVIQFFNSDSFGCEPETEDGYAPNDADTGCMPHDSDYNPQDWDISLSELLRLVQFFNSGGYFNCPEADPATEDGYCPGLP